MKFVSHRGNLIGKEPEAENTISHIENALLKGYDVEIDIWEIERSNVWLGHDESQTLVDINFIKNEKLWCHAKNINALRIMIENNVHCFWHQQDEYTLTSNGYIWSYPTQSFEKDTIAVLPEQFGVAPKYLYKCVGICSDFIQLYKEAF